MSFFVVAKNPLLSEGRLAAGVVAWELDILFSLVGCLVISEVLYHLEALGAALKGALVCSYGQVALDVLLKFRVLTELLVAVLEGASAC